jgi:hypothetical protein
MNTGFGVCDKYLGSIAPRRTAILMLEKRPNEGFCISSNDRVSRVVLIAVQRRTLAVYPVSGQRRKSLRTPLERWKDNYEEENKEKFHKAWTK